MPLRVLSVLRAISAQLIQETLQQQCRSDLIDDAALLAAAHALRVQAALSCHTRQPFVPKPHGHLRCARQVLCELPHPPRGVTFSAIQAQR